MRTLHPDIERVALLGWPIYPASTYSRAACIKEPGANATCDFAKLEAWSSEFPAATGAWSAKVPGYGLWMLTRHPTITLRMALLRSLHW